MIHDRLQCFLNDFWNFVNFIKYPPSGPVLLMDYYLAYYYLSLIYGLLIDILLLLLLPPPPPIPDSQNPQVLSSFCSKEQQFYINGAYKLLRKL
jgi:hypothetical protein